MEEEKEWNGGKYPNRERRSGMALSEFEEMGANSTETAATDAKPEVLRQPGGAKVREEPTGSFRSAVLLLPIAGIVAGIVAAIGVFAFIGPRRKRDQAPYDEYGTRRVTPAGSSRGGRYLERL